MKIRLTLELEFADLPAEELVELERDLNDEDDPLPVLADYSEDELRAEAINALTGFFDGDYVNQAELWAGSNFYVWIKSASVVSASACPGTHAALKTALDHIEHMAAFIGVQKLGYSFESLGEDMPGMRAALGTKGSENG